MCIDSYENICFGFSIMNEDINWSSRVETPLIESTFTQNTLVPHFFGGISFERGSRLTIELLPGNYPSSISDTALHVGNQTEQITVD